MAYYIGLMSGTSMDGCDAALISTERGRVRLVSFLTHPMPAGLKQKALDCCSLSKSNVALVCSLNVELGYWFSEAVHCLLKQAKVDAEDVTAIGSHGQTVYHIPFADNGFAASTLQLGEPAVIAYETGIKVVSSMRAMDMAAGGQGAPLVPYSEYVLYRSRQATALQNIGGIGNVTVLPAYCAMDEVFAFDTGPGNMVIDGFMRTFFGKPYDENGRVAKEGRAQQDILDDWMRIPYVDARPPKSTGRELYGDQFIASETAKRPDIAPRDWVATATRYTALTMRRNYDLYIFPRCPDLARIVVGGGGAHNAALMDEIRGLFPHQAVLTQEDLGFSSDAKEAVAFALIARETLRHRPGNMPSATGAKGFVPLGSITWPPNFG